MIATSLISDVVRTVKKIELPLLTVVEPSCSAQKICPELDEPQVLIVLVSSGFKLFIFPVEVLTPITMLPEDVDVHVSIDQLRLPDPELVR